MWFKIKNIDWLSVAYYGLMGAAIVFIGVELFQWKDKVGVTQSDKELCGMVLMWTVLYGQLTRKGR